MIMTLYWYEEKHFILIVQTHIQGPYLISCSYRVWSCIRCFVYANYSVYVVFITIVNVFKQLFIYKVYVLIIDVQNMS